MLRTSPSSRHENDNSSIAIEDDDEEDDDEDAMRIAWAARIPATIGIRIAARVEPTGRSGTPHHHQEEEEEERKEEEEVAILRLCFLFCVLK